MLLAHQLKCFRFSEIAHHLALFLPHRLEPRIALRHLVQVAAAHAKRSRGRLEQPLLALSAASTSACFGLSRCGFRRGFDGRGCLLIIEHSRALAEDEEPRFRQDVTMPRGGPVTCPSSGDDTGAYIRRPAPLARLRRQCLAPRRRSAAIVRAPKEWRRKRKGRTRLSLGR